MKKVSVIMGALNQKETLEKVLPYYENQTFPKEFFEVVIVDSTSNDGSKEFFDAYTSTVNIHFHIKENKGKAAARNSAVALSTGDIIIVTDADMIPDKNFVKAHYEAHQRLQKPACFEGLAWNLDSYNWPPKQSSLSPQVGKDRRHLSKLGWFYFLTGNLSISRSLFNSENGFNELFLGYGWEDLELGYRLHKKKVPLYYLKTAINFHYHVITNDDEIRRNIKKGESAKIFLDLHPELKLFLGLNCIFL